MASRAARELEAAASICFQHLFGALRDRGLSAGRIGIEANAVSARDYPDLQAALNGFNELSLNYCFCLTFRDGLRGSGFARCHDVSRAVAGLVAVPDKASRFKQSANLWRCPWEAARAQHTQLQQRLWQRLWRGAKQTEE